MKSTYSPIKKFFLFIFVAFTISLHAQDGPPPIIRLLMTTNNFNDETVFYFQKGGTTAFQSQFDAYKLIVNAGTHPYLASLSDSILTSISGLPELPTNLNLPVKAITPVTKTFTFSTDASEFNSFVCVTLFDAFTGISTNILTQPYVCTLYDTTTMARFTLNFYTTPLNTITKLIQATCSAPVDGRITASASGNGPWIYEWRKNDSLVKVTNSADCKDSLNHLSGGQYTLRVNESGTCSYFSKTFVVDSIVSTITGFASQNINNSNQINFINSSSNSQVNTWNFGDNSEPSHSTHPTHFYSNPGTYSVTLISQSSTGCSDTSSKIVEIQNKLTGISSFNKNTTIRLATLSHGNYELMFSFDAPENIEISLVDIKGTSIQKISLTEVSTLNQFISLDSFPAGMYLLNVSSDKTKSTFKIIK